MQRRRKQKIAVGDNISMDRIKQLSLVLGAEESEVVSLAITSLWREKQKEVQAYLKSLGLPQAPEIEIPQEAI